MRLIEEYKKIDSKIQESEFRDQFRLEQSHAVSLMELQALFLRFRPNIVHFSGHGSSSGALIFEDSDGKLEKAPSKALSNLFRIINDSACYGDIKDNTIRCVVLNACYSLKQAKAIADHVDCVIGISDSIKNSSATNFAASFYQGLAYGQSIQTAFDLGCNQLGLSTDTDESILKLKHKTDVDPAKIFLASKARPSRSIVDSSIQNPEELIKSLSQYSLISSWGSEGTESGQFREPKGIAIDSSDNVYVCDSANSRIQKFTSDGKFLMKWDIKEEGSSSHPIHIAIDSSDNVYVCDWARFRIQKFTSDGKFLMKWGDQGSQPGQFEGLQGIAIDSSDNVYVCDSANSRIQKFTSDGKFLMGWTLEEELPGMTVVEMTVPNIIAIDSSGTVFVCDKNANLIQKFTPDGKFLSAWSPDIRFENYSAITIDRADNLFVCLGFPATLAERPRDLILKYTNKGECVKRLEVPLKKIWHKTWGIAIDSSGKLYVSDYSANKIRVFS